MKTSIKIHKNAFKSTRVKFTENEVKALVKFETATTAAVAAWKSVKKDTLSFARRLQRVHALMVKGNSPKSLFSKWLKSVGIPRATAYWTLKQSGNGSGKKPLSVKQLIQKRGKLQDQLANAEKDEKKSISVKLDSVKGQLARRREVLQNRLDRMSAELKEVVRAISDFNGTPEAKGFGDIVGPWMAKTDALFSKMTIAQQKEYVQAITNSIVDEAGLPMFPAKKPSASVRTIQPAVATA